MSQRTQAKQRTREALLDAALTVIAGQGYQGARLDVIAAEAGYSTGAVYASFAGKDELFRVLVDRELTRFLSELSARAAEGAGIGDKVRRIVEAYLDYLDRRPEFFAIAMELWLRARTDETMRDFYRERQNLIAGLVAVLIEEGAQQEGLVLAYPSSTIATLAEAMGEGMALRVLVDPGSVRLADFTDVLNAFLSGVVRPG